MRQVLNIAYNAQVEMHSTGENADAAVARFRIELERPPRREIAKGRRVASVITPELDALMGGA